MHLKTWQILSNFNMKTFSHGSIPRQNSTCEELTPVLVFKLQLKIILYSPFPSPHLFSLSLSLAAKVEGNYIEILQILYQLYFILVLNYIILYIYIMEIVEHVIVLPLLYYVFQINVNLFFFKLS